MIWVMALCGYYERWDFRWEYSANVVFCRGLWWEADTDGEVYFEFANTKWVDHYLEYESCPRRPRRKIKF